MATVQECYALVGPVGAGCDGCKQYAAWTVESICSHGHGGSSVVCRGCLWSILSGRRSLWCCACHRQGVGVVEAVVVSYEKINNEEGYA